MKMMNEGDSERPAAVTCTEKTGRLVHSFRSPRKKISAESRGWVSSATWRVITEVNYVIKYSCGRCVVFLRDYVRATMSSSKQRH